MSSSGGAGSKGSSAILFKKEVMELGNTYRLWIWGLIFAMLLLRVLAKKEKSEMLPQQCRGGKACQTLRTAK